MQAICRVSLVNRSPALSHLSLRLYNSTSRHHFETTVHDYSSELGLRSNRPPDSSNSRGPPGPPHVSDQDWEIRTGRAIYVLQQTLPEFFHAGLVTSMDKATGTPRSSSTSVPIINANPLDPQSVGDDDIEVIYSPKIRLSYTPPVALPPPFPDTLHVEGFPLYLASAVFIRHTLNALYTNLGVELRKVVVTTPQSGTPPTLHDEQHPRPHKNRKNREKSLLVGFCVTGTSRVSGAPGEWEVSSTYSFSPTTGLIDKHTVDSIYPAPHQAVYESLRMSLGKVFGLGIEDRRAGSNGAACVADAHPISHSDIDMGSKEVTLKK